MLLMMGMKMTVMMAKGKNKLLMTHKTHRSPMKWKTPSHLNPATGLNTTALNPLEETNTGQKDVLQF